MELFLSDKNPSNEVMRDFIYNSLVKSHLKNVQEIEQTSSGWNKYWTEVLQSTVSYLDQLSILFSKLTISIYWLYHERIL